MLIIITTNGYLQKAEYFLCFLPVAVMDSKALLLIHISHMSLALCVMLSSENMKASKFLTAKTMLSVVDYSKYRNGREKNDKMLSKTSIIVFALWKSLEI